MTLLRSATARQEQSPAFRWCRLCLVRDQFAQERNQHDERNTDREAAGAKLREQLRVPGVGRNRPQRPRTSLRFQLAPAANSRRV